MLASASQRESVIRSYLSGREPTPLSNLVASDEDVATPTNERPGLFGCSSRAIRIQQANCQSGTSRFDSGGIL